MPKTVVPGSWQDIWKQNPNLKNPNLIKPGQEIKLPNGSTTLVDKGDTLSSIAQKYRQGLYNPGQEVSEPTRPAPATPSAAPVSRNIAAPASSTATKLSGPATMGTPAGRTITGKDEPGPAAGPGSASSRVSQAPAAPATPSATAPQGHPVGTMVSTQIKNPKDPSTPLTVTFYKRPNGTWATLDNAIGIKPSDASFLEKEPAYTAPYGATAKPDFTKVPLSSYAEHIKGPDGEWYKGSKVNPRYRVVDPALKRHLEQKAIMNTPGQTEMKESIDTFVEDFKNFINNENKPYGKTFDKILHRINKDKKVTEFQNRQSPDAQITSPPAPAATQASRFTADMDIVGDDETEQATMEADGNAQDPSQQVTSPASPVKQAVNQQQAAQKKAQDERQDLQTALGTVSSLKPYLGAKTDVNQAASAITKISNNQPLTAPESQAVSSITPLVMKAAETPASAAALKTALTTAGVLGKQGK
jgi:hypothetical protein